MLADAVISERSLQRFLVERAVRCHGRIYDQVIFQYAPGSDAHSDPGLHGLQEELGDLEARYGRRDTDPWIEEELRSALVRLNPHAFAYNEVHGPCRSVDAVEARLDDALRSLRQTAYVALDDTGLLRANERMHRMLVEGFDVVFADASRVSTHLRLVDYAPIEEQPLGSLVDPLRSELGDDRWGGLNRWIISDEVESVGRDAQTGVSVRRRFDVVIWLNGLPLVIVENKRTSENGATQAAEEIERVYQAQTPSMFVPNLWSIACDGEEILYGAIGNVGGRWTRWSQGETTRDYDAVTLMERSWLRLTDPNLLLLVLRHYVLFVDYTHSHGGGLGRVKFAPRWQQVEASELAVARFYAEDLLPGERQGLVKHNQGAGKTYFGFYTARRALEHGAMLGDAPTIVLLIDRLELLDQTLNACKRAGMDRLQVAKTKKELRRLLHSDQRHTIVTTIQRFGEMPAAVNERSNILVVCDEAHRSQEGQLGYDLRRALPNATFIGATGSPVQSKDRSTYEAFGSPLDGDSRVLSEYTMSQAEADGAIVPLMVTTAQAKLTINHAELDRMFAELGESEDLDEDAQERLARSARRMEAIISDPDRLAAIAKYIVDHVNRVLRPNGLKGLVVAYNRRVAVKLNKAIEDELARQRWEDGAVAAWRTTVVMSTDSKRDAAEDAYFKSFIRDQAHENLVKQQYLDVTNDLSLLVVTDKLLTGFDAPLMGAVYLDRAMRGAKLFQAISRPNRRWVNPVARFDDDGTPVAWNKQYGLIVDFQGLGAEIAAAMGVAYDPEARQPAGRGIDGLYAEFAKILKELAKEFTSNGITVGLKRGKKQLDYDALQRVAKYLKDADRETWFHTRVQTLMGIYDMLAPAAELKKHEAQYLWLIQTRNQLRPIDRSSRILWSNYGPKTLALIHDNIDAETVEEIETVMVEPGIADRVQTLIDKLETADADDDATTDDTKPTVDDVVNSLEERIKARLERADANRLLQYESLAQKLEELKQLAFETQAQATKALKALLELARELEEVDAAVAVTADGDAATPMLDRTDRRRRGLRQVFEEWQQKTGRDAPLPIDQLVDAIEAIAAAASGSGWKHDSNADIEVRFQLKSAILDAGLEPTGELFERAYAYVRTNY